MKKVRCPVCGRKKIVVISQPDGTICSCAACGNLWKVSEPVESEEPEYSDVLAFSVSDSGIISVCYFTPYEEV